MTISKYTQHIIYTLSLIAAFVLYIQSEQVFGFLKMTQSFGFAAFVLLYFTLLLSAIPDVFPTISYKNTILQARKALGISTLFFSTYHAYFGFFGVIGGFEGWKNLSGNYMWSLAHGLMALGILAFIAIMSVPYILKKMNNAWQYSYRSIYIAGVFMLAHGVALSMHLLTLKALLVGTYIALIVLLGLDIIRIDRFLTQKFVFIPKYMVSFIGFSMLSFTLFLFIF